MKLSPALGVGVFLVFLALVTATGAVSLQTSPLSSNQPTVVTGLAYSAWFIILSIAMAGAGMALIFLAGREEAIAGAKGKIVQ